MTGLLPLRDFQVWFAPVAWRLGRPENAGGYPLARHIELRIAEYTNGHWSETQLLEEIGRLLRPDRTPTTVAIGGGNLTHRPGAPSAAGWYAGATTGTDSEG
jgi:hypothetical protein